MNDTERISSLRQKMITTPAICIERGYYMTESYRETEGEPEVIRRAKALRNILDKMTIRIEEEEMIAGWATSKMRGGAILPEVFSEWILEEVDTVSTREWDKYAPLSEDEKEKLREFIPYWKGRCLHDQWVARVPLELQKHNHVFQSSGGYSENAHHPAHVAVDYEKVLSLGINGLMKEVEGELEQLDLSSMEDIGRHHFLSAVKITCEGILNFAKRYEELASEMAQNESDPARKAELEQMASVCSRVPANPAGSFREAIQSVWFVYIVLMIEGWGAGMSLGRCDQYLYPYYRKDADEGAISSDEVHELLSILLVKMNGVIALANAMVSTILGGYPIMQGFTLGGVTKEGSDAVNELSYAFLEAEKTVGLNAEDAVVRISRNTPDSFLIKACEVAKALKGKIKFVSDDTTIQSMLTNGITIEEARDYISSGCHNPTIPALSHDLGGVLFNLPLMLELALNDGVSRLTGDQIGPKTGDPRKFASFEEVSEAYRKQVEALYPVSQLYKNVDIQLFSQVPVPFQSSLYRGCIQKGRDMYEGGAKYNTHSTGFSGVPNVGDSLAAIKKVVFEDGKVTMEQLVDALDRNFEGAEDIHYMLKCAPKFGNDLDCADLMAKDVLNQVCEMSKRYKGFEGRQSTVAAIAMTANVPLGYSVGALPDGRKAGEPLSEGGISPYQGRNVSGPTATMRSVAKLDQVKMTAGSILNMRFSPGAVSDETKMKKFVTLVRTFAETGGNLVQFNFLDNEILSDAQKHPEKYKDLLVRVATYSAYFVELSPELQNDIISRMEFESV